LKIFRSQALVGRTDGDSCLLCDLGVLSEKLFSGSSLAEIAEIAA
jgi:hypothetical protein